MIVQLVLLLDEVPKLVAIRVDQLIVALVEFSRIVAKTQPDFASLVGILLWIIVLRIIRCGSSVRRRTRGRR